MKKLLFALFTLFIFIGFTSCEAENTADTDTIYASDKDEEPDRDDRDS